MVHTHCTMQSEATVTFSGVSPSSCQQGPTVWRHRGAEPPGSYTRMGAGQHRLGSLCCHMLCDPLWLATHEHSRRSRLCTATRMSHWSQVSSRQAFASHSWWGATAAPALACCQHTAVPKLWGSSLSDHLQHSPADPGGGQTTGTGTCLGAA